MEQTLPSAEELQDLVSAIQNATKSYDAHADAATSHTQRAAIRTAASTLYRAVSTPYDHLWQRSIALAEGGSFRIAYRLGIFAAVPVQGSISRAELAKKVSATESLIERQMRVLVTTGVFEQTPTGGYAHTKFSRACIPGPKPTFGMCHRMFWDVIHKPMAAGDDFIVETARDGIYSEAVSIDSNPFVRFYGSLGESFWDVMARQPGMLKMFQESLGTLEFALPPTGPFFDFSRFKATGPDDDQIQIVDVGGGAGYVLQKIVQDTPALDPTKCILQDVAPTIAMSHEIQSLGVQTQVIDFFKEQPTKGAKAYYMRMIVHDYADPVIIGILSIVARAMGPDSTLLIYDNVLPDRIGEDHLMASAFDQLMLVVGGKERTVAGFKHILNGAGLELVEIHPVAASAMAIVEARTKKM